MPVLDFSRAQLTRKLDRLTPLLRVVFAAACAERLLPAYIKFAEVRHHGDPEALTYSLARLWEDVGGNPLTESEVQSTISTLMDLIPPDDDVSLGEESDYAEDACVALIYALTCRQQGDGQESMWSAERAFDALHQFVVNRDKVDLNALGALGRVLADPLIQAELARQRRDIDELLRTAGEDVRQVATRFRERAKSESKIFFGMPS